mmetsp:Transcript_27793/g.81310  ORF Transcript_27793/g.81310 Transcript_27793/m.81310 type:complete len:225 (-) Transcript_27793:648-1322(-)
MQQLPEAIAARVAVSSSAMVPPDRGVRTARPADGPGSAVPWRDEEVVLARSAGKVRACSEPRCEPHDTLTMGPATAWTAEGRRQVRVERHDEERGEVRIESAEGMTGKGLVQPEGPGVLGPLCLPCFRPRVLPKLLPVALRQDPPVHHFPVVHVKVANEVLCRVMAGVFCPSFAPSLSHGVRNEASVHSSKHAHDHHAAWLWCAGEGAVCAVVEETPALGEGRR